MGVRCCAIEKDADVLAVETYAKWLYSHNLPTFSDNDDFPQHTTYCRLHVFGEKLMHDNFRNAVLDAYMELCSLKDDWPLVEALKIIWEGTTAGSPAHQLMVDVFCWRGETHWVEGDDYIQAPTDFMCGCLRALMGTRDVPKGKEPWNKDMSQYHRTGEGKKEQEAAGTGRARS